MARRQRAAQRRRQPRGASRPSRPQIRAAEQRAPRARLRLRRPGIPRRRAALPKACASALTTAHRPWAEQPRYAVAARPGSAPRGVGRAAQKASRARPGRPRPPTPRRSGAAIRPDVVARLADLLRDHARPASGARTPCSRGRTPAAPTRASPQAVSTRGRRSLRRRIERVEQQRGGRREHDADRLRETLRRARRVPRRTKTRRDHLRRQLTERIKPRPPGDPQHEPTASTIDSHGSCNTRAMTAVSTTSPATARAAAH